MLQNSDQWRNRKYEREVEVTEYGADKAVILNIVHSELYRIIILPIITIINSSISLLPHLQS
jgi:hypothetical protein